MPKLYRNLILASVCYLLLPNLLFFFYWFRFPIGPILVLALGFFTYRQKYELSGTSAGLGQKEWLSLILIGILWTLLAGIGNYVAQAIDFQGHNAKFFNLVEAPWPLLYEYNNKEVIYYFSFYLVPAFVMKSLGGYQNWVILVWGSIGYVLVLTWAYLLLSRSWKKVALFLLMGESGVFFNSQVFHKLGSFPQHEWPVFMGSLFEQSAWVPNQFLPTALVLSIFIYLLRNGLPLKWVVFPFVLSLTWGVFPAIGMALVILGGIWASDRLKEFPSFVLYALPYLMLVIPIALFYQSSNGGGVSEFLLLSKGRATRIPVWAGQIFPQVIVFGLFIYWVVKDEVNKRWAWMALSAMFILSMFRVGVYNDLYSRNAIVFFLIILWCIVQEWKSLKGKYLLIILLCVDLFFSLFIVGEKLTQNELIQLEPKKEIFKHDDNATIYEYFKKYAHHQELIQYSSKEDSFYQRYLANH